MIQLQGTGVKRSGSARAWLEPEVLEHIVRELVRCMVTPRDELWAPWLANRHRDVADADPSLRIHTRVGRRRAIASGEDRVRTSGSGADAIVL